MQNLIQKILEVYPQRGELNIPFGKEKAIAIHGKHEIKDLFEELKNQLMSLPIIGENKNLLVETSYGLGQYAAVPWAAIMDKRITKSTQNGVYIVFLFSENGERCYLSLAQGVEDFELKYKSRAYEELRIRATEIQDLFPEIQKSKFSLTIQNSFESKKGKSYEASIILSLPYLKGQVPINNEIESDLTELMKFYEGYVMNSSNDQEIDSPSYDWVPFFKELAVKLLEYENNQKELLNILENIRIENSLNDQDPEDVVIPMSEIDPFTFFSLILKYGTSNRKFELFNKLKDFIDLESPAPQKYSGVPTSNAQSAWFFRYKFDRSKNDIGYLWTIFKESLKGYITEASFNNALSIKKVGKTKLTQGLFWASPEKYFPIDAQTIPYLTKRSLNADPQNLDEYLKVCNDLLSTGIPLYEHSYLAWRERKGFDVTPVINKRKIWAIATGQDGDQWGDFLKNDHVSIGWHEMGDLDQYSTQKDIQEKLEDLIKREQKPTNDAKCLFQFSKEIQIGDVVVAKSGRKQIKGAGIITSDYIYDDSKGGQPNIRMVKWMRTDATEFPGTGTAIKALTEISGYPDFKLFVEDYLNMRSIEPLSEEYGVKEIIEDGCFLSINELNKIIGNLENKKILSSKDLQALARLGLQNVLVTL